MRNSVRVPLALTTVVVFGAATLPGCTGEQAAEACKAACQQKVRTWIKGGEIGVPPVAVTAWCKDNPDDAFCPN